MMTASASEWQARHGMLDVLIRAGLIAVLAVFCYRVFHPFLNLMLWSIILAVTLYPLQRKLGSKLGLKEGRTATLIVVIAVALLLIPTYLMGVSMASSVAGTLALVRSGTFEVPAPADPVAGWPLIGPAVHGMWLQAATDLTAFTQQFAPQIRGVVVALLGKMANFGLGLLSFIVALILAGIFMAYGENGHRAAVRIASRISGVERGPKIAALCTNTIRAVAQGVIGIAFIQAVLVGVGFVMMGAPATGLLILAVLMLGIMQVPATLVTIPVIAYVLSTEGATAMNIVLAIYVFVAGLVDNVLKPLLLGRGVEVPMPVVLIGALGGMVTGGIIGLFIGPVILGVGYQLFWQWVDDMPPADAAIAVEEVPATAVEQDVQKQTKVHGPAIVAVSKP